MRRNLANAVTAAFLFKMWQRFRFPQAEPLNRYHGTSVAHMFQASADPASDAEAVGGAAKQGTDRNDGPPVESVSQSRVGMLLSGALPCYNPTLMKAYGAGLRAVGSTSNVAALDELHFSELPAFLRTRGDAAKIALHMIISAAAPTEGNADALRELRAIIKTQSLLQALVDVVCHFCTGSSFSHDSIKTACAALSAVACPAVFTADHELPPVSLPLKIKVMGCCIWLLKASVSRQADGVTVDLPLVDCALQLYKSGIDFFMESDVFAQQALIYQQFADEDALSAFFHIVKNTPRSTQCFALLRILLLASNYSHVCDAMERELPQHDGCSVVALLIDAISSMCHDEASLRRLLVIMINFAQGDVSHAESLIRMKALEFLQPALMHSSLPVACESACLISVLACVPGFEQELERSDVLPVLETHWRMRVPGHIKSDARFDNNDLPPLIQMLSKDSHPAVQLTALHTIAGLMHNPHNRRLFLENQRFVALFRECASSRDAFVYIAAIFLLQQCDLPLPCFSLSKSDAALEMTDVPVKQWSIDHVCAWVGQSTFRAYKHTFREGLVMLAPLSSVPFHFVLQ
jgi:hypothetical protein